MTNRFKNPWFWIGLIGIILTAMGIDPSTLTSWAAVGQAFMNMITNPFMLATVAMAVLGVFVDPSTKGLGDSIDKELAKAVAETEDAREDIEKRG